MPCRICMGERDTVVVGVGAKGSRFHEIVCDFTRSRGFRRAGVRRIGKANRQGMGDYIYVRARMQARSTQRRQTAGKGPAECCSSGECSQI